MEENIVKKEVLYPYLTRPVEIYERENGHKVVLAHKEGGLVNISSWVKTGSINENDENNGISHFLEHLMFKGTHKHKAGYFDKTLEAKGAIVNAATWKDYTFYYVTLPKGPQNAYMNEAIELHADMMLDPVIPEDEIGPAFTYGDDSVSQKRERHVVIEEIRMRQDQPWTKVYNNTNKNMYTNHPYKRDVIGHAETIASIPREVILDYYKTHYTPNNITTIVAGDFDSEEVLEKVVKEFDFKGRQNYQNPKHNLDEPVNEEKYFELKGKINTGFAITGWLGPIASDIKDNIGLEIINIVLGEGQSSRLYQNLVEKVTNPGNKTIQRIYDKTTGKIRADLICLADETFDESKDMIIFDPMATWKKTKIYGGTYTLRELLVPVFQKGRCVYTSPSVMEIRDICQKEMNTLWDETRRLVNPQEVYVDLSDKLYKIKTDLLEQMGQASIR